jgi:outer membrane protein assembly factor BamB
VKSTVTLALALAVGGSLAAADWPQFRGPNGSAVSTESALPTGFSDTAGLRWKASLPGRGVSSPVVVGKRVYVTCSSGARGDRLHVIAFDAESGEQLWHRQLTATGSTNCHPDTCMAAPTPAADGTGVFALFASGDLAAFDADGTLRWYRSFVGDYPTVSNQVGMAASPVLAGGKLIVPMDNTGESFLAALDVKTGRNLWKVDRPRDINWVTPVLRTDGSATEVVFPTMKDLVAYDLETGARTWASAIPGAGIPSPTVAGNVILYPTRGLAALSIANRKTTEQWKSIKAGGGMSSPLVYNDRVYSAASSGMITCTEAKTGKVVWQERLKGKFSASPVAGDGKVYLVSEEGYLYTLKAGDEYEVLAESKLGERGQATPAISGGAIFHRGDHTLWCIGQKPGR